MAQKVIAARDFDLFLDIHAIGLSRKILTATNFTANISGNTEDIGAISTDEPIATDNGGNTYSVTFSLQQAEAQDILDAYAAATANSAEGSAVHIRDIVESATITAIWHKRRDVPATSTVETYTNCTGVSEDDSVERRATETIKTWAFQARGKMRQKVALIQ